MKKILITCFAFVFAASANAQNEKKPSKPSTPSRVEKEAQIPFPPTAPEAPTPPDPPLKNVYEVPVPSDAPEPVPVDEDSKDEYKLFLKKNPEVRSVHWKETTVTLKLKSGKEETYHLNDKESIQKAEAKYGELPAPPPPPPLPPPPAPKRIKV